MQVEREAAAPSSSEATSNTTRIAHTLTACCRCRARKTRCDPGLPRCGPCERTNSHCEYFDQAKATKIPRNYVVHLQHKVRELEKLLEHLDKDDGDPEPEEIVRHGARVQLQDHDDSKYLGPSSGIAITRLVMQLAKQFTDSQSITDIVDQNKAVDIKKRAEEDLDKPTSMVYPLISDVAATELPARDLTNLLMDLFNCKVMAMYPFFHEPTLAQDVEDVYNGSTDAFQNFAIRLVIAVSLQRMDTQYAGLADSYYLAALKYLDDAVKPMNVKTIQCFMLIGTYSLLTPTRTAVYYVVGLAVRLAQALGLCEEKSLCAPVNGKIPNALEIDMRRRVFWSIINMDYALAHSLGRSSCFATLQEHVDVQWYETVDDQFITTEGVRPGAPGSLKKWISIHFHKMRLHQLEIRRKLYQRKRETPKDDSDPWFHEMEKKITTWRDASPETDVGTGLNKAWFIGRYNTMIAMLFRPTPQIPRPNLVAAQRCYAAVISNIYMHRAQIQTRSVDMTWIFTQAIFMTINTVLWTLSYYEIRKDHPREEVKEHLDVALHCIKQAVERWPGVASAIELYENLIRACMKIYDKDGDIPIAAGSPAESGPGRSRSQTTSPVFAPLVPHVSVKQESSPPPPQPQPASVEEPPPCGFVLHPSYSRQGSALSTMQAPITPANLAPLSAYTSPESASNGRRPTDNRSSTHSYGNISNFSYDSDQFNPAQYDNPLPTYNNEFNWNPNFNLSQGTSPLTVPALSPFDQPTGTADMEMMNNTMSPNYSDYLYPPSYDIDRSGTGLNQEQHSELMHNLEIDGMRDIQQMITAQNGVFYPQGRGF
ncbi:hypothetical protein E2P81_ATG03421 [Venturia nashicola]|nr:hypothetical protein E2P81_ATG03421 [Venturia nashicola]